jgi:hypothetical protein
MDRKAFVLSTAAAATIAPAVAGAQTLSPQAAVVRLLTAPAAEPAWFSAGFLAAVPIDKINVNLAGLRARLGAYQSIAPNGERYTVTFANGTVQASAALDSSGAFTALLFNSIQNAAAADRITALFRTNPIPAAWFSDRFLAEIPVERTAAIVAMMKTQLGDFQRVAPDKDGSYDATFAKGSANVKIALGSDGKIEGLFFKPQ